MQRRNAPSESSPIASRSGRKVASSSLSSRVPSSPTRHHHNNYVNNNSTSTTSVSPSKNVMQQQQQQQSQYSSSYYYNGGDSNANGAINASSHNSDSSGAASPVPHQHLRFQESINDSHRSISNGNSRDTTAKRRSSGIKKKKRKRPWWRKVQIKYTHKLASFGSIILAVLLWYSLGIISISTTKYLLMTHDDEKTVLGNVPPLYLTLQQQCLGCILLRALIHLKFLNCSGLQSLSKQRSEHHIQKQASLPILIFRDAPPNLLPTGFFFSIGFFLTNVGFKSSSAAFVETIKAAEPLTSASLAVAWNIETLGGPEMYSLGAIVAGVLLSTLGGSHSHSNAAVTSSVLASTLACCIVMASNLCFSLRGLYQKLLRALFAGNSETLDDLNLQYRMQQIGVVTLAVPVLLWDGPSIVRAAYNHIGDTYNTRNYILLALLNGCAFTCYNLASTFILSRISVIHHAALNCLRRIFAIIVTSIIFSVPITFLSMVGILISVIGFMSFTHYKVQKQKEPRQLTSLLPTTTSSVLKDDE